MQRLIIALLVAMVIIGALAFFMMTRSLPGDALYGAKVGWYEMRSAPENDPEAEARFVLERMERRLGELKRLSDDRRLSAENIDAVASQVSGYVSTFAALVYDEREHSIPPKELLDMLSELSVLIRAQQHVVGTNPEHAEAGERIENLWREVTGMRLEQIGVYVYEAPVEEVVGYISEQITKLSGAVESGELSEAEMSLTNYQLTQAAAALARSNFADAIDASLQAEEFLRLEEYVGGSEAEA